MMTRRRWLAGAAGAFTLGPSAASAAPGALAEDLPLLQRAFERLHPGLYRYQTPDQFRARAAETTAAVRGSDNAAASYLALSKLTASVRCGHTYANFFNQSQSTSDPLFGGRDKLPFHFVWIDDRMVVTANPMRIEGLQRGSEIGSIDDTPVAQIQQTLLAYVRADGSNDAKRRKLLDVTGGDRFETFDVFKALRFSSKSSRFDLRVRARPGAPWRTHFVDPIDLDQRRHMAPAAADDSRPDYWRMDFPRTGIARITMPGWAVFNSKWDWRARIDALFEEIAQNRVRGLVIDLRDNEGGLDCGYDLIARLVGFELPLFADYDRCVRFRTAPADLAPYLDTWDPSFKSLGESAEDLGNGFFRLSNDGDLQGIKPKGPRFTGHVAVLCGAQNSSATFNFIDIVQRHGLGRTYGEPTGGNQRGINGGAFFFLRLPNSGLEVDLPLIGTFSKTHRPDAGLLPDAEVRATVEDIADGRDPVLDRAVADMV